MIYHDFAFRAEQSVRQGREGKGREGKEIDRQIFASLLRPPTAGFFAQEVGGSRFGQTDLDGARQGAQKTLSNNVSQLTYSFHHRKNASSHSTRGLRSL